MGRDAVFFAAGVVVASLLQEPLRWAAWPLAEACSRWLEWALGLGAI